MGFFLDIRFKEHISCETEIEKSCSAIPQGLTPWDRAKSEQNELERGLPFELAILLFDNHGERVNDRRSYGELRIRALGTVGGVTLHCVYARRGEVRRIISPRYANRKERDAYRATYSG
jgi:hypothetical protein